MPSTNRWSPAPNTSGLKIKWDDGWIEDLPEDEFADECKARPGRIRMYKKGEDPVAIEYMLKVAGVRAELDYGGPFLERNSSPERDIYIGVTRVTFTDRTRTTVRSVLWKYAGKRGYKDYEPYVSWARSSRDKEGPFRPPARDRRKRGLLTSVLRPGQIQFRARLLDAYARRCAITGCAVENALEAAHIMPYFGPLYDHSQNGILMRADLHRLFDAGLWSINPRTLRVELGRTLKSMPDYQQLHNSRVRLPRLRAKHPSKMALKVNWRSFGEREKRSS